MVDRAYTVAELDDLRQVMEHKYVWGTYTPQWGVVRVSRSFLEEDKVKAVEEMVRTAMLAGHTADDYRQS